MKDREKQVGCLNYYDNQGKIAETVSYEDAAQMRSDLQGDMECGRPVLAVVYHKKGQPLAVTPQWFSAHCESMSAHYKIEKKASNREERGGR